MNKPNQPTQSNRPIQPNQPIQSNQPIHSNQPLQSNQHLQYNHVRDINHITSKNTYHTNNPSNTNKHPNTNNFDKKEFVTSGYLNDFISSETIGTTVKANFGLNNIINPQISSNKASSSLKVDFPSSTDKKSSNLVKPSNVIKISSITSPNGAMSNINSNIMNISGKNSAKSKESSDTRLNDFKPSHVLSNPQVTSKPKVDTLLQKFNNKR